MPIGSFVFLLYDYWDFEKFYSVRLLDHERQLGSLEYLAALLALSVFLILYMNKFS